MGLITRPTPRGEAWPDLRIVFVLVIFPLVGLIVEFSVVHRPFA